jgi:formate/nitrite transporter
MSEHSNTNGYMVDAYAPQKIAALVEGAGVRKANLSTLQTLVLGILAGAFISFGAMLYTVVMTDHGLGFGPSRLLGGVAFSLGLILVIVGGAELFTGNNLIVMAWAENKVGSSSLLRNWILVYVGNFIGAVATACIAYLSGTFDLGAGAVGKTAAGIALAKVNIPFVEAFLRAVLCNALVCLAVWLSFAAHHVSGKILAIVFPISAFVALGFEHSIANMYFIPVAFFAGVDGITVAGFISNLVPVTLGNIVGGSVFVALAYWVIYLRKSD